MCDYKFKYVIRRMFMMIIIDTVNFVLIMIFLESLYDKLLQVIMQYSIINNRGCFYSVLNLFIFVYEI